MEVRAKSSQSEELLDLSDDALINIFRKLDLEALIRVGSSAKKLQQVVDDEMVWMERCRTWDNVVNIKSWRARMDSGKALYRALHSLSKLAGLWTRISYNPRGELLYVTWGFCGLHVWQVIPSAIHADEDIQFNKLFEVVAEPDGSHKVKGFTALDSHESLPSGACIVLPSAESRNEFVVDLQLSRRATVAQSEIARELSLSGASYEGVKLWELWSRLYNRLATEEPRPGRELSGLWTGLYGPHGWEILSISYSDDFIIATKITGDPNVPAGQITFKCALCTETSDVPEILEYLMSHSRSCQLTKMYEGEGRIAEENFLNPNWVPGLLLVEQTGNFHFVWTDVDFMIGFHRVDLEAELQNYVQKNSHLYACETQDT